MNQKITFIVQMEFDEATLVAHTGNIASQISMDLKGILDNVKVETRPLSVVDQAELGDGAKSIQKGELMRAEAQVRLAHESLKHLIGGK